MLNVELIFLLVAACGLAQLLMRAQSTAVRCQAPTTEDYLYKIARVTGKSEYDIFCKSAENWPVSPEMINKDFKDYLMHHTVPYYVNDFIRKNKDQIDALRVPPF